MCSSAHPPAGTEDRSKIKVGISWNLSKVALELFTSHGLTARDEDLGVDSG